VKKVQAEERSKYEKEIEKAVSIIVWHSITLSPVPYLNSLYLFVFQRNEAAALAAVSTNTPQ
jgi:hypothetical protein